MNKWVLSGMLGLGFAALACGSTDSGNPGGAGSPGSAGSSPSAGAPASAGSTSSAGAPGSAGSTSSAGAPGSAGTTSNPSSLCEQQFDAMEKECPVGADSKDANVQVCKADQQDFAGIGCLTQFNSWLTCTATNSAYDCQMDTGCETSQASYFTCQSQAVQRTGCVRLGSQDATRCSDATKPYAFSCLSTVPSTCVQVVTEGAGIWCCPQL